MPKKRINMRKLKEVFRLKFELGRTHREIATSCKMSAGTASDMVCRFADAGLQWPCELSDSELERVLYAPAPKMEAEALSLAEPDWNHVHHELRRRDYHVTPTVTFNSEAAQMEPSGNTHQAAFVE